MSDFDTPKGRDYAICAALIAGHSVASAAEQAGVSKATVQRIRRKWTAYIANGRQEQGARIADAYLSLAGRAAVVLADLLNDPSAAIKLGAARTVADQALRWRAQLVTEAQVAELVADMERIKGAGKPPRPWLVSS